jgi:predicted pyridoxine 5'-phosphate oxidase superfamily flavin-nucleotide-binding protein
MTELLEGAKVSHIESVPELTSHFGVPTVLAQRKDLDYIDEHARAFIARSPFLVMSTADADGWPDASPRGDAPGFVAVESSHTLLMPERPGNNRVDSITPGHDRGRGGDRRVEGADPRVPAPRRRRLSYPSQA